MQGPSNPEAVPARTLGAFLVLLLWIVTAPVFLGSVPEATVGPGPLGRFLGAGGGYALFTVLGLAAGASLLPWLIGRGRTRLAPDGRARLMLGLLAALPALALLQLVPLPLEVHRVIAPAHAGDLGVVLPERSSFSISTDPELTLRAAVFLSLLLLAACSVVGSARGPRRPWILLGAFVTVATLGAAYGILETCWLGNHVLSHAKGPADTGVTGTFYYRGNFAAFSAAALGVAASMLVRAFRRGRRLTAAGTAMAVAVLTAGLLLSKSRAGMIAGALAAVAGLALTLRTFRQRLAVAVLVTLGAVAAVLSVEEIRERFGYFGQSAESAFLDIRVPAWESTLELAAGRRAFGCGLGAYRRAIHLTQSDRIDRELFFAHSDPLNLLAEGGYAGLMLGTAVAALGLLGLVTLLRRGDEAGRGLAAACGGGLAGISAMALVDFPLQVPATALVFTVLLFLPYGGGAIHYKLANHRSGARGPVRRVLSELPRLLIVAAAVVLSARECSRWWGRTRPLTRGEELAERGAELFNEGRSDEALVVLREARERQPFVAATRYRIARVRFHARGPGDAECERELIAAHHLARGMGELLYEVGTLAYRTGQYDLARDSFREAGAIHHDWFQRAFRYFTSSPGRDEEMARSIVPERPWAYMRLGNWHRSKERIPEALDAFWRARELGERGGLEPLLADIYRRSGREEDGRKAFAERGLAWPE